MDREQLKMELQRKREANKIIIKKALILVVAVFILLAEVYTFIVLDEKDLFVSEELVTNNEYEFHPNADFAYDIMKDSGYQKILAQQPLISLKDSSRGEEDSLLPEEYESKGNAVALLCKLVLAIQAGDHETYNSCFSDAYIAKEGEKSPFTMQQIYNVLITKVSEKENKDTATVTHEYSLRYMIRHNNGTFRLDMGSDSYREQTFVMIEKKGDTELKISSVSTEATAIIVKDVHWGTVILSVCAAVVLTSATVVGTVFLFKAINKKSRKLKEESETK